jgi:hypothetical protein
MLQGTLSVPKYVPRCFRCDQGVGKGTWHLRAVFTFGWDLPDVTALLPSGRPAGSMTLH